MFRIEDPKSSCGVRALVLFALIAGVASADAFADVVTSISGGTPVPMPAINDFGTGPQTFGPGITWNSTNTISLSVFGYTGVYSYASNGLWDGALGPMAGLNDSFDDFGVTDTMTFSFATPVGAVGGLLNYAPFGSTPTTIAVYNSRGVLIESDNLTFLTGGGMDTGMFLGFQESTADIASFTLTGNYIGITNLTLGPPAGVPEPDTIVLVGSGLAALVWFGRKRTVLKT